MRRLNYYVHASHKPVAMVGHVAHVECRGCGEVLFSATSTPVGALAHERIRRSQCNTSGAWVYPPPNWLPIDAVLPSIAAENNYWSLPEGEHFFETGPSYEFTIMNAKKGYVCAAYLAPPPKKVCRCDMRDLMTSGHAPTCEERR